MKTITVKLPANLRVKLDRAAKHRGQTKSAIVRAALEYYLGSKDPILASSCLEAAWRWIGRVEGPGDLSTNPRYLEDFGK